MGKKIACFDIFGTSFGFENVIQAVDEEFGDDLRKAGTTPAHTVMAWFYATQRDFTYLSVCEEYTAMAKVFAATLPRSLAIALDPAPLYPSTSRTTSFPSSSLDKVLGELKKLTARPGLVEAFHVLWDAGFEVYAVSNGAKESTAALLAAIDMHKNRELPEDRKEIFQGDRFMDYIVSCDEVKKAKPALEVYKHAMKRAGVDPSDADNAWFVAAHSWDLLPARKAGYRTAYVTFEEIVQCEEIFGQCEVVEDGLAKAAKKIVELSSSK